MVVITIFVFHEKTYFFLKACFLIGAFLEMMNNDMLKPCFSLLAMIRRINITGFPPFFQ